MPNATSPWRHPPELPDNARMLCLVFLEDRRGKRSFQIMRYVRHNWRFQEGLGMGDQRVLAWAAIDPDIGTPVKTEQQGAATVDETTRARSKIE